jgi:hypothetical protein
MRRPPLPRVSLPRPPLKRVPLPRIPSTRWGSTQLPVAIVLTGLVVIAVLTVVTGSSAKPPTPLAAVTAPVTSDTLVCPSIDSSPPGTTARAVVADLAGALTPPSTSSGTVTATTLSGAKSATQRLKTSPAAVIASRPKVNQTIAVDATGSVAATLAADQVTVTGVGRFRSLTDSRCEPPATDWWFVGANGNVGFGDTLTLSNPAPTAAEVTVGLWGPKGSVSNPQLNAIHVNAQSAIHLSIASIAPDLGPLTVHVHANSGAVTAALLDRRTNALRSDGADYLPPTQAPARSAVVAGYAQSPGAQALVLGNPGDVDASVSLKLVTQSGSFVPSGKNQLVVQAGRTRIVNLDRAFNGATGAVEVSSDQPVVAQGLSVLPDKPRRPDLMWLAATARLGGPAAVADGHEPDGGHCLLLLSAPAGAAQVKVTAPGGQSTTISVPAGHSVSVDVTNTVKTGGGQWGFVATPIGAAPVYGVRVLSFTGAHGALIAGEPLVELPTPILLPPVRADPRVATH